MIIDGKAIAERMVSELASQKLDRPRKLGIIVVGDDPVIESFVRIKQKTAARIGVEIVRVDISGEENEDEVVRLVEDLSARVDGVIVQLPLPTHMHTDTILAHIPRTKDVDGINPDGSDFVAPVALAVQEILRIGEIDVAGKRAVVLGAGRLVGTPAAILLQNRGATVSVITLENSSLEKLKDADIIVSGVGSPGLITPDLIKEGCVLIDAGTSDSPAGEGGRKIAGDADPACADRCALFTPVPGGVGPIAVAMIFKNLMGATK